MNWDEPNTVGKTAKITGLISKAEYNGLTARVEACLAERKRFTVRIQSSGEHAGARLNLKPENLIFPSTQAGGATASATSQFTRILSSLGYDPTPVASRVHGFFQKLQASMRKALPPGIHPGLAIAAALLIFYVAPRRLLLIGAVIAAAYHLGGPTYKRSLQAGMGQVAALREAAEEIGENAATTISTKMGRPVTRVQALGGIVVAVIVLFWLATPGTPSDQGGQRWADSAGDYAKDEDIQQGNAEEAASWVKAAYQAGWDDATNGRASGAALP